MFKCFFSFIAATYGYDKVGNLLTQTDARGNITSYTYDKNYNVKTITSPTGTVTTYTYDELNRGPRWKSDTTLFLKGMSKV
ncbi:MAG: hypothetical protein E7264_11650 [Lachnospiraceae bacterium]|nr:hypothetical protein [Lachnospiraceae bacterium]